MSEKKTASFVLDGITGALFIAWFFFPVGAGPAAAEGARTIFLPYSMPFEYAKLVPETLGGLLLFGCYFLPAFGLLRIFSAFSRGRPGFIGKPDGVFAYLGRILATVIAVYAFVLPRSRSLIPSPISRDSRYRPTFPWASAPSATSSPSSSS